jgi:hypothetical protein
MKYKLCWNAWKEGGWLFDFGSAPVELTKEEFLFMNKMLNKLDIVMRDAMKYNKELGPFEEIEIGTLESPD